MRRCWRRWCDAKKKREKDVNREEEDVKKFV
jgi:hypothetical protein